MLATIAERVDGWGRLNAIAAGADARKLPDDVTRYALRFQRPEDAREADEVHRPSAGEVETDTMKIARWFALHN